MDLINITDIQDNETNVNWYENGEPANADVLNRPTKQVAEIVNEVITKLQDNEVSVGLNSGGTNQGTNAIAIGENAGKTDQPANSIAIGLNATPENEGDIVIQTTSNAIKVNADGMTMNAYRGGHIAISGSGVFDGNIIEAGHRLYGPNNKPTADDVGALPYGKIVFDAGVTSAIKGKSYLYDGTLWACLNDTIETPAISNANWYSLPSVESLASAVMTNVSITNNLLKFHPIY